MISLRERRPKRRCGAVAISSPLEKKVLHTTQFFLKVGRLFATDTVRGRLSLALTPRNDIFLFLLSSLLLFSCSPNTTLSTPELITVYSTSAAQPWLPSLYECAGTSTTISRVDDSTAADIVLRVGEPDFLNSLAYQIDAEEILIVTHRQSPVQNLNLEGVRALFMGQGDPSVKVLVYASGEDVQEAFDRMVMEGRTVTPSARIAVNPQHMSDTLVNEFNTVGILPRHWKVGDAREVFNVGTVPVLAITNSEPQGVIQELIACLQK